MILSNPYTRSSLSLIDLVLNGFSSFVGPVDDLYPQITLRIVSAIASLDQTILDRDLIISMPKLEEVDIEKSPLTTLIEGEEENLGQQCIRYLGAINQFNNYVGQGAEETIAKYLNGQGRHLWCPKDASTESGYVENLKFVRNTVQFPDLYLIDAAERTILLSVESKTWFVFSGDDITARFHTSPNFIKEDSLLVLFPWVMTNLIYGSPKLLKPYVCNARELAERRDKIWLHSGVAGLNSGATPDSDRLSVPDVDHIFSVAPNQHNVKSTGYQIKVNNGNRIVEVETDNFGKIWRIYDEKINIVFARETFTTVLLGKPIKEWKRLLKSSKRGLPEIPLPAQPPLI